ncbi:serine/threonine-protein phosphatase 6 regulatory ankyrin repeat subunit A-like isoform X1 [Histomonas meleagridis]|uniref:serine/threonine-protein phosphatase 6 regulatory ankyrin repeat subunit A-like isoform X1 n=1 Tax=Histomonas meleagridis TaxID=135588 RepID=UPI00355AB0E1|nr:serine/threonine-protein phosphatase 6 regulatory ankyrin repeat subunit A-like isoform X1 [Histomonas meleagridis]KAH0806507.1 serine/threonine-protein phosphatase 6 regulatory ankyrin repeat subunit A-like isoform X1 [Histomonas meleagridis]
MSFSFAEANISTLIDICMNSDRRHLQQQIESSFTTVYGLDFLVDDQKQNLLHILAASPNFTNWRILLSGFIYLNAVDSHLQTPLFISTKTKNIQAIRNLIANGASAIVENEKKINPIKLAIQTNYFFGLKELLVPYSSIRYISTNFVEIGKLCLNNDSLNSFKVIMLAMDISYVNSYDDDGFGLIHYIVQANNLPMLKVLIPSNNNFKVDINLKSKNPKMEKTPIEMATSPEIVEYLYGHGAVINKRSQNSLISDVVARSTQWGTTGKSFTLCDIHKAAIEGNILFLKSYNKKVIDVVDIHQMTPLLYAISYKHIQFISALIEKGANPNFFTGKTTAYHFAALKGDVNAFFQMFCVGIPNFETLDAKGRTIIACAVASKNVEMVKSVMSLNPKQFYEVSIISKKLITYDSHLASLMMEHLLSKGTYPLKVLAKDHKTLLQNAIEENKTELAMTILNKMKTQKITDFEPNAEKCLISSVIKEEEEVLRILIEDYGMNPSILDHGKPLIFRTTTHKSDKSRNIILKACPQLSKAIDQMGNTILHYSALLNSTLGLQSSIETSKIPINCINHEGETALIQLLKHESDDFRTNFELLIKNKAHIYVTNSKKQNILHICSDNKNVKALTELISTKNNHKPLLEFDQIKELLSQKDIDNDTPLQFSSKLKNTRCSLVISEYEQLPIFNSPITLNSLNDHFSKGYSANVYNKEGICLLIYAINQKYENKNEAVKIIQIIIDMGGDPSLVSPDGLSAIHHAINSQNKEIVKVLVENGANFIVDPVISTYARQNGNDEILDYVKSPEKRASAINELLSTQLNAVPILNCICNFSEKFGTNPTIRLYMEQVKQMHRLLRLFARRFKDICSNLKPSTEIGSFLLYFADAFLPFLQIAAIYDKTILIIRNSPVLSELLNLPSGYSKLTVDDALIVPTQQFTYYPELIKAIINATPDKHLDLPNLRKAHAKFAYIVRIINERKLIVESQKELQTIKFVTTIHGETMPFYVDDVLLTHGQFELKNFSKPKKNSNNKFAPSIVSESENWGIKTLMHEEGGLYVEHFEFFGRSMESFLNKGKIEIFLFKNNIIMGIQKTIDKFKMKFSCKTSNIIWDFNKEHGLDAVMLYAPFGNLLLKFLVPKGSSTSFERNKWRSNIEKLFVDENENEDNANNVEQCYTSWVGENTKCVYSHTYFVQCKSQKEAKEKILNDLKSKGVNIMMRTDQMGELKPMICFDFQTIRSNERQERDVISDLAN